MSLARHARLLEAVKPDPFTDLARREAQFDRDLDLLATDHGAFVKRLDAACERHLVDLREGVL